MYMYGMRNYRIAPNFQGAKFSRIGLLKHFAEINFADQRFLIAVPVFFETFHGSRRVRENRENYAPRKFGAIRYYGNGAAKVCIGL